MVRCSPSASAPPTMTPCNVPQEAEALANCPSLAPSANFLFWIYFEIPKKSYLGWKKLNVKKEASGSNALNEGMECVFKKNTTFSDCCRYKTGLKLTTALFITVVSAVIVAVANRPKRHAAVVRPAGKLCMVVTSISWSHFGENSSIINIFF